MPIPLTDAEIAAIDARSHAGEKIAMWCMHHEKHWEWLTEPLSNRINYVKAYKSAEEIPVRLREIQPVKNVAALLSLQKAYAAAMAEAEKAYYPAMAEAEKAYYPAMAEARKAYYSARAEARKAYYSAMVKAEKAYYSAMAEAQKAYAAARAEADAPILALHRFEYPDTCWNGLSIFDNKE